MPAQPTPDPADNGPANLEPMVAVVTDEHAQGRRQQRGCLITFFVWLLALGLFFGLHRLIKNPDEREKWEWLRGVATVVLIFPAPAFGILQAIELKTYLNWKEEKSVGTVGYRLLIILGCWLSAAVAGGVGLLAILAMFHNSASMNLLQLGAGLGLALGILAVAVFLVVLPFRRGAGMTEAEQRKMRAEYEARLAHPDFEGIEKLSGAKLPELYKSLLTERVEWRDRFWTLYPRGVEDDEELYDVVGIVPAHPDALRKYGDAGERYLAFARGEYCEYWLELGPDDPPVYSRSTEADDPPEEQFVRITKHLSDFLSWPKVEV